MKYIVEIDPCNFEYWSGAKDVIKKIEDANLVDEFNDYMDSVFSDSKIPTETEVNDFVWHNAEDIYDYLGMNDSEDAEDAEDIYDYLGMNDSEDAEDAEDIEESKESEDTEELTEAFEYTEQQRQELEDELNGNNKGGIVSRGSSKAQFEVEVENDSFVAYIPDAGIGIHKIVDKVSEKLGYDAQYRKLAFGSEYVFTHNDSKDIEESDRIDEATEQKILQTIDQIDKDSLDTLTKFKHIDRKVFNDPNIYALKTNDIGSLESLNLAINIGNIYVLTSLGVEILKYVCRAWGVEC